MGAAAPKLLPVQSSAIAAMSLYDPQTKSFVVKYKSGGIYRFEKVTAAEYTKLLSADSLGGHLNKHFRDRGVKVEN